jgi:hypothetical protein
LLHVDFGGTNPGLRPGGLLAEAGDAAAGHPKWRIGGALRRTCLPSGHRILDPATRDLRATKEAATAPHRCATALLTAGACIFAPLAISQTPHQRSSRGSPRPHAVRRLTRRGGGPPTQLQMRYTPPLRHPAEAATCRHPPAPCLGICRCGSARGRSSTSLERRWDGSSRLGATPPARIPES